MANTADYKTKYMEIRDKLIESIDIAFRDGYEQDAKEVRGKAEIKYYGEFTNVS